MKYYIVNNDFGKVISAIALTEPVDDTQHYTEVTEEEYNKVKLSLGMNDDVDDMGMPIEEF